MYNLTLTKMTSLPVNIWVLLFVAGFAILSIEILGNKILSPYVGTTLPVWGALISTALLGSMIGYYGGGFLADARYGKKTLVVLSICAGLSTSMIPYLRVFFNTTVDSAQILQTAVIASVALFLLPVTFFSSIITYTIRQYVNDMRTLGQVHGDLYTIATIGSISGVFGTSYALIPFFTIPHILSGLGVAVVLCGIWAVKQ